MATRAEIVLGGEGREALERQARRPKSSQALAFRCRIVSAAAERRSSREIAAELGCNHNTVGEWRGRFARRGFDGLHDEPRSGKPRTISDEQDERLPVAAPAVGGSSLSVERKSAAALEAFSLGTTDPFDHHDAMSGLTRIADHGSRR